MNLQSSSGLVGVRAGTRNLLSPRQENMGCACVGLGGIWWEWQWWGPSGWSFFSSVVTEQIEKAAPQQVSAWKDAIMKDLSAKDLVFGFKV